MKDAYNAPVFRSKPEIDVGFLHGGFWNYTVLNLQIFIFFIYGDGNVEDETEGRPEAYNSG